MKKLALALVCLFSLAFFASCDPEGLPSISVLEQEGYVTDGSNVYVNDTVNFGFSCVSSLISGKPLASLIVSVENFNADGTSLGSSEYARKDLNGMTEYVYTDAIVYNTEKDEFIGSSVISAIVTDAAGQIATVSMTLSIYEPEMPLFVMPIEWKREGSNNLNEDEMKNFGLMWTGSYKEVFATLKPIVGGSLYVCNGDDFDAIEFMADKDAYIANLVGTGTPVESYRNITTNNSADYNDMLVTMFEGKAYMMHITHALVEPITNNGQYVRTDITITGELK